MREPFSLTLQFLTGDPEGVRIIESPHSNCKGLVFPRTDWEKVRSRQELKQPGIYFLWGTDTVLNKTVLYIGHAETLAHRLDSHDKNKLFWHQAVAFISNSNHLNKGYTGWLEYELIRRFGKLEQIHLHNEATPKEPYLSEFDKSVADSFLNKILLYLPLLGFSFSETRKPSSLIKTPQPSYTPTELSPKPSNPNSSQARANNWEGPQVREAGQMNDPLGSFDTVVVPAQKEGFEQTFLAKNRWYEIRIADHKLDKIKYLAVYQTNPVCAITHYAPVERIAPYGNKGKYCLFFSSSPIALPKPIAREDAGPGMMQGPQYTSLEKLLAATKLTEVFSP